MSVRKDFLRDGERVRVGGERTGDGTFRVQIGDAVHDVSAHLLPDGRVAFELGGRTHVAVVAPAAEGALHARVDGHTFTVHPQRGRGGHGSAAGTGVLTAPMTGTLLDVLVEVGQQVEHGQTLVVLSAMKMEHKIVSDVDGTVAEVGATPGDPVEQGRLLVRVEPAEASG